MAVHIDILDNFPPTSVPGLKRILQNTEILRYVEKQGYGLNLVFKHLWFNFKSQSIFLLD